MRFDTLNSLNASYRKITREKKNLENMVLIGKCRSEK